MALSEQELEKQLMEAGNQLLSPPSSVSELLPSLDRVESLLTRVEQSPSDSMKKALSPSMRALITNELLRHSDVDVKVAVASCISEITRITAPDAPYEDDQMKEVFQLIVSSFEKLDDKSSPSYVKRTSILETVAKVRSCVVMLDLECDALIAEMFQHFFRSIREEHPENVFSSMETIMTLVLEESEDISADLISSILDVLKTENKEVLPVARQLGEKVIEKCASKLKPYLLQAVKSCSTSLDDYSKVVANVCQAGPETVQPSDGDAGSKNVANENDVAKAPSEKAVEVAMETQDDVPPEEVAPATVGSPKSVMSNGSVQKKIEDASAGNDNAKETTDHDTQDEEAEPSKSKTDNSDAKELTKSRIKPEKANKRKGRKTNSLKSSSEPTLMDGKKEAGKVSEHQEKDVKDAGGTQSEDPVAETARPDENEKVSEAPIISPETSDNEPVDAPSASPSGSLADENRLKKIGRGKKKDDSVGGGLPVSDVSKKESDAMKASEGGASGSESKFHKRTGKKVTSAVDKEDSARGPADISQKDDDTSKVDAKLAKQSGKKVKVFCSQSEDEKKRGQGKGTPAKDLTKTPKDEEKKSDASPMSTEKSTKGESDVEKSSSKRRRPGEEKASGKKVYGEELVGSKVKVWWPADKKFYEGAVKSFDSVKRKHKVVYNDGDVEVLKLDKEKWMLIDDEAVSNQGHLSDDESPDESAEMPKAKKAKTSGDPRAKRGKIETPAKKAGASSSKSKATPKSVGGKQKDKSKADGRTKEDAPKNVGKSEDKGGKSKDSKSGNKSSESTRKSVGKSKDDDLDTSKGSNKSKQGTSRGATMSKGKSPKSGSKSNTVGSGKVKPGSSAKEKETEDVESPEPAKALENSKGKSKSTPKSQKSAKKRKRGTKG